MFLYGGPWLGFTVYIHSLLLVLLLFTFLITSHTRETAGKTFLICTDAVGI